MPAKFLYNLTKNLSAHIQHKFCAVLPYKYMLPKLFHMCNIFEKRLFKPEQK